MLQLNGQIAFIYLVANQARGFLKLEWVIAIQISEKKLKRSLKKTLWLEFGTKE